jgi:hypothetical protein
MQSVDLSISDFWTAGTTPTNAEEGETHRGDSDSAQRVLNHASLQHQSRRPVHQHQPEHAARLGAPLQHVPAPAFGQRLSALLRPRRGDHSLAQSAGGRGDVDQPGGVVAAIADRARGCPDEQTMLPDPTGRAPDTPISAPPSRPEIESFANFQRRLLAGLLDLRRGDGGDNAGARVCALSNRTRRRICDHAGAGRDR